MRRATSCASPPTRPATAPTSSLTLNLRVKLTLGSSMASTPWDPCTSRSVPSRWPPSRSPRAVGATMRRRMPRRLLPPRQRPPSGARAGDDRGVGRRELGAAHADLHRGERPRGAVGHCLPPRRPRAGHRAPRPGADRRRPRAAARDTCGPRARERGRRGRAARDRGRPGVRRRAALRLPLRDHPLGHAGPALERARQPADARRGRPRRHRRRRDPQTPGACASAPTATSTSRRATPARASRRRTRASRNGKILRLSPDQYRGSGSARPEIYARGVRNPQGLDWQPGTDRLFATDHGPSGFDGPSGNDEVNAIREGGNYGWPERTGRATARSTRPRTCGRPPSRLRAWPSSSARARHGPATSWWPPSPASPCGA